VGAPAKTESEEGGVGRATGRSSGPRGSGARGSITWLPGLLVGAVALLGVHLALRDTYWDYSEGVYAYSAHLMLHGRSLYTSLVGAQPPGVFLAGAALLAVHESLEWLRFGVALLQLGAGLIAGRIVLRITGDRLAAMLTPALFLLTPWAVHEHGALTPELVALPVLMGAALLCVERRGALAAGILCGLLPLVKVPFAIPAIALVALSADVRRTARWAIVTLAAALALTTLLAGGAFWRDAVLAQTQLGIRSLGVLKGFWAQAGWNLLGLLLAGAAALRHRGLSRDPRMLRVAIGLALAMIVTFLTNFKEGTGLNIAVPVEAALVPLAVSGTVLALHAGARRMAVACVCALLFTLAQGISLMASPERSLPFLRAGSKPAWAVLMTGPRLQAAVAAARRCPPGVPYSGPPLIAFAADRPMPAGQADQFIVTRAGTLSSFRSRLQTVQRVCP
jgi:hypothetical protein